MSSIRPTNNKHPAKAAKMNRRFCQFVILWLGFPLHLPLAQADGEPDPNIATSPTFVVMTFNVGTTLGLAHDQGTDDGYTSSQAATSDRWYGNGLAWLPAIAAVRETIRQLEPDVVAFQEIFDCRNCEQIPIEQRQGFVCETWSPGDPNVARMVLGDDYQIAYHPGKRDKCLAVHRRFGLLQGCQEHDCETALEGYPIEGCGSGARVARALVQRCNGNSLTIISIHGTSGFARNDQRCRVQQLERVFIEFGDGKPGVGDDQNLILGDFNTDPGRAGLVDASAKRWNDFVGEGKRFHFVSKVGSAAPRAYGGLADIDHVVTDAFRGQCLYLGLDPQTKPVWQGVYFDHVPVICTLSEDH